jgi:hypothetical protein
VDVRKVHFNGWHARSSDGITKRYACVGISCGVEDNRLKLSLGLLNPSHQFALEIGLSKINFRSESCRPLPDQSLNVLQRRRPIDRGFTLPKKIEVWTVENENMHWLDAITNPVRICPCLLILTITGEKGTKEGEGDPSRPRNIEAKLEKSLDKPTEQPQPNAEPVGSLT